MSKEREFVIGIDTGGTYTDAVLLDYQTRKIVAFNKTLTTRDNLTRGITTALSNLPVEKVDSIRLIGVSSTLATNSIAEGKERPAGVNDPQVLMEASAEGHLHRIVARGIGNPKL